VFKLLVSAPPNNLLGVDGKEGVTFAFENKFFWGAGELVMPPKGLGAVIAVEAGLFANVFEAVCWPKGENVVVAFVAFVAGALTCVLLPNEEEDIELTIDPLVDVVAAILAAPKLKGLGLFVLV